MLARLRWINREPASVLVGRDRASRLDAANNQSREVAIAAAAAEARATKPALDPPTPLKRVRQR